jgi:phenylpropionate dioxygenase-like ring-hydroxylating dioxygenase large terminal subunit
MKGNIDDLVDRAPDGALALDVGMHRYAYNGNWKLQVENVLDSYHVPFGHASTVNKQGVQFARREGDQKGAAVVETEKKQTAASWKDRKSYIAATATAGPATPPSTTASARARPSTSTSACWRRRWGPSARSRS